MFGFMEPPRHVPQLSKEEIAKKYPKYRLRMFLSVFFGYASYYLTRSNFALAAPHLIKNLGLSISDIGNVRAGLGLSYGFSKFFMGIWSDRSNPRYFMSIGLIISGILNFFFPYASAVGVMFILMFANGWVQGMGWPPAGRTMTHWFSASERGTKMAIWNCGHNIGGGTIAPICVVAFAIMGWKGMLYVPGLLAIAMGIFILITLRDTPQSVGLPSIEEYKNDYPAVAVADDPEKELTTKEILFKYVLTNKYVWLIAFANAFVYCVRYGVLDWSPTYLMHVKNLSIKNSGWGFFLYEYAGIPGTLLAGWMSDKLFRGRRSPVTIIFMALAMAVIYVYWKNPVGNPRVDLICLSSIGFLIYGPVMLIGVSALDMVPKKAAGTAAGFTGLFGYVFGTVAASSGMGYIVKWWGWSAGFYMLFASCIVAIAILAFTWNFRAISEERPVAELEAEPVLAVTGEL